jgi:hypothetical protein
MLFTCGYRQEDPGATLPFAVDVAVPAGQDTVAAGCVPVALG